MMANAFHMTPGGVYSNDVMITAVLGILAYIWLVSCVNASNELSYPDSVQFLHKNSSVSINCSNAPIARTNWREYLACKRLPAGIWRPLATCSEVSNGVITLTVNDANSDAIIPSFSETFYYISESQLECASRNVKMIIHRCDPVAPKCNKCTLPLGIQDGRIPVSQLSASSLSTNSRRANKITDGSLNRPSRGWCAGILDDKQFLEVDLGYERVLTGVGTRKTDTVEEFLVKYKKELRYRWHYYEEGENAKLFQVNRKSKGISSRHWLAREIRARYLRFHVTKWRLVLCFHVEVYGCDDDKMFQKYGRKKEHATVDKTEIQVVGKSLKGHERRPSISLDGERTAVDDTPVDKAKKMPKENEMDTNDSAKHKYNRSDALIACYVASGIIAVLGLIIVCIWNNMERKIRPDYLKVPH